ncbi:hypothetical protein PoB_001485600 [Plakobranchus ocellatus]|uniref:Uncharacterized protein n=1 Tax=Plakobranchus ocellatus TaxID=259542 RepID=A0AAV3YXV4_9GAST|nr:hypothetical protein PoB_001485600 [Plakobranchus ocellatus]
MHQESLQAILFKPDGSEKGLHEIDFGTKFVQELSKVSTGTNICAVRQRCEDMLVEALNQINKRIPHARRLFKNLLSFLQKPSSAKQRKETPVICHSNIWRQRQLKNNTGRLIFGLETEPTVLR